MFRIAKPGEFTFKRDDRGVETVEHQGLIIGIGDGGRGRLALSVLSDMSHDTFELACDKAAVAGFWVSGKPSVSMSPVSVTVQV